MSPRGMEGDRESAKGSSGPGRAGRRVLAATVASIVASTLAAGFASPALAAGARLFAEAPRRVAHRLAEPEAPLAPRLEDELPLLRPYLRAEGERPGAARRYLAGPFSRWRAEPWLELRWFGEGAEPRAATLPAYAAAAIAALFDVGALADPAAAAPEPPAASLLPEEAAAPAPLFASTGATLASNGFGLLWTQAEAPPGDRAASPSRSACERAPVTIMRYGAERDDVPLVGCDGIVAEGAQDRLSILARPALAPHPAGDLLPDEPDPSSWEKGEWTEGVRIVHPRLVWALQQIADAFPNKSVYLYSGYRPGARVSGTGHASLHASARALDMKVIGVPNDELFRFCRKLRDVGCGYYPNSKFVHVDVRKPGTGHAYWIDASGPGEPSRYVDAWPGVLEGGALAWDARAHAKELREKQQASLGGLKLKLD